MYYAYPKIAWVKKAELLSAALETLGLISKGY